MILFVGDIHGNTSAIERVYKDAIEKGVKAIVQVGDFGIYWPGKSNRLAEFFNNNDHEIPLYFCDGNHENHRVLDKHFYHQKTRVVEVAKNCFHVRRGSIIDIFGLKLIFFGGAQSYLGNKDTPFLLGENWWPRELPSWEEFSRFGKSFEKADIEFKSSQMAEGDYWFVEEYVRALDQNRDHECNGMAGRHVIEIIMGIFESAAFGRHVDLPQVKRDHPLLRWREEAGFKPPDKMPLNDTEWLEEEEHRLNDCSK